MGLMIERLEGRTLFAGNVVATVDGARLILEGDGSNNDIDIDQEGLNNGQIRVDGDDDNGTTVNGSSNPQVFNDIRTVIVRLKGGNDDVDVEEDIVIRNDLRIGLGGGADECDIEEADIRGDLLIRGKSGRDDIDIEESTIAESALIRGGSGGDFFDLRSTTFEGDLTLRGRGGDDFIVIRTSVDVLGDRTITGGPGDDTRATDEDGIND